jgi:hypothetical protein
MRTVDRFDFNDLLREVQVKVEVAVVMGSDGGDLVQVGGGKTMV